jgi:hypothetical protein
MNSRNSVLRGQRPNASHFASLQAADTSLRMVRRIPPTSPILHPHIHLHRSQTSNTNPSPQELLAITDSHVDNTLRAQDASQGKWLAEDPSLTQIQQTLMSR